MKRLAFLKLAGVLPTTGVTTAAQAAAGEGQDVNGSPVAGRNLDRDTGKVESVDADGRPPGGAEFLVHQDLQPG